MKNINLLICFFIIYNFYLLVDINICLSVEKYKVDTIDFTSNKKFSSQTLKKLMLTKEYNLFNRHHFQKNLFDDDLNVIQNFYINEGYLEANVNEYEVNYDTLHNRIKISIDIFEGERTFITGISFFGNKVFSDSILYSLINSKMNRPFRKSVLEKDNYNLLVHYADEGYLKAKISPTLRLNEQENKMLIDFNIEEGLQLKIGKIKIVGIQKTKRSVVLRELKFSSGDIYNYSNILKSQRELYLTGLFNSVFIKPDDEPSNHIDTFDIKIKVDEKKNGELNFGLGYGTVDRMRGSIELLQNNILGTAKQAGISMFASFITRRAELSFTEPWLFSTRTKADINGFIERREEPGYDLSRHGGKFTLGRKFGKYSNMSLAYRYEIVTLNLHTDQQITDLDNKGNTRSLTFTILRDTRNDIINSTQGSYTSLDIESAGAFLRGTSTFLKFIIKRKNFYPISKRLIIASGLTLGWAGHYGRSKEIPIQERFFTGGPSSIRGFKEKYVGPKNEFNNPIGGNILLSFNLIEIRHNFYKKFSSIFFLDMGNVWTNSSSILPFSLRKGAGIGIRYNSPLGILRLDYGMKLDRQPGESSGEFYFSVGQAF